MSEKKDKKVTKVLCLRLEEKVYNFYKKIGSKRTKAILTDFYDGKMIEQAP